MKWNRKGYDINNNIVYEIKNGKGHIKSYYNNGNLKFECEYLNGEKNGIGKEYYYNDKIQFEGVYLNGVRNGKGKEYYYNGKFFFEGDYLNNNKWNGKGYDMNNNIAYEIKNGKGYIKLYYIEDNRLYFEGESVNGQKNGKGKEYYDNSGVKFEGEYLNEEKNGKGISYNSNGILSFEGEYLYNFKLRGREYINGKLEYEEEYFYNKKWNGKGYDENGNIIYILNNGNGKIREYYDNGKIKFEGEYLNDVRNGKGKEYDQKGRIKFEGEYLNNKINDKGKQYYENDMIEYEGEYLSGERNGKGKDYNDEGDLIFEGDYSDGKRWNGKKWFIKPHNVKDIEYIDSLLYDFHMKNDINKSISIFEGEYLKGKENGKGKEFF